MAAAATTAAVATAAGGLVTPGRDEIVRRTNELLNYRVEKERVAERAGAWKVALAAASLLALIALAVSIYMGIADHSWKWLIIPVILTIIFTMTSLSLIFYARRNPPAILPETITPSEELTSLKIRISSDASDAHWSVVDTYAIATIAQMCTHYERVTAVPLLARDNNLLPDINILDNVAAGQVLSGEQQAAIALVRYFVSENATLITRAQAKVPELMKEPPPAVGGSGALPPLAPPAATPPSSSTGAPSGAPLPAPPRAPAGGGPLGKSLTLGTGSLGDSLVMVPRPGSLSATLPPRS